MQAEDLWEFMCTSWHFYRTDLLAVPSSPAGAKLPKSRYLGRVVVELDQAAFAPKLCENFRLLCTGEQGVLATKTSKTQ